MIAAEALRIVAICATRGVYEFEKKVTRLDDWVSSKAGTNAMLFCPKIILLQNFLVHNSCRLVNLFDHTL